MRLLAFSLSPGSRIRYPNRPFGSISCETYQPQLAGGVALERASHLTSHLQAMGALDSARIMYDLFLPSPGGLELNPAIIVRGISPSPRYIYLFGLYLPSFGRSAFSLRPTRD
jgi:hypothetical protein